VDVISDTDIAPELTPISNPFFFSGHSQEDVDYAESLCQDLINTVKREHEEWKSRPPPPPQDSYGQRSYGGRSVSNSREINLSRSTDRELSN